MIFAVENESHCDFTKLREMLIRTNMEDLRDTTHTRHYELYRKDRLQQVILHSSTMYIYFHYFLNSMFSPNEKYISFTLKMGFSDNEGQPGNFAEQYATRRESHLTALQSKEEEMRQKFVIRVKEKESELKEAEREVIMLDLRVWLMRATQLLCWSPDDLLYLFFIFEVKCTI